ncbi:MAG: TetR/AcrR family transcriptional regulator [Hyphomonadaceae bacterium]
MAHRPQKEEARTGARGPHAERSAAMRKRLISAAIDSLCTRGFGATTLQVVTDEAGVSRGAVLHHFPTKVDLMLAVAEYAAGKQNRHVARLLADTEPGMERFLGITAATWDVMSGPPAIALLEIMMGSRSDPELRQRLAPVMGELEAAQREGVWEEAERAGIKDRETIETMVYLHIAAMRGLVLDLMFSGDAGRVDAAVKLLVQYKLGLTGRLITQPFEPPSND